MPFQIVLASHLHRKGILAQSSKSLPEGSLNKLPALLSVLVSSRHLYRVTHSLVSSSFLRGQFLFTVSIRLHPRRKICLQTSTRYSKPTASSPLRRSKWSTRFLPAGKQEITGHPQNSIPGDSFEIKHGLRQKSSNTAFQAQVRTRTHIL